MVHSIYPKFILWDKNKLCTVLNFSELGMSYSFCYNLSSKLITINVTIKFVIPISCYYEPICVIIERGLEIFNFGLKCIKVRYHYFKTNRRVANMIEGNVDKDTIILGC